MYYAVVDCDNCYVSCERVFRPDLRHAPVVVLSNNDGCVVARSNEAKRLGIKAGTPYYQLAGLFPDTKIAVFSSNYELYGEMTARVMSLISKAAPSYFRYSIDEAFCILRGMDDIDLKQWGEDLHRQILKYTGMPVSIGIGPNKTLAKMASHYAKHYPGYRHCCLIDSDEKRLKALKLYPLSEVWGIGRRIAQRLEGLGDTTAFDFAGRQRTWVRANFNVVTERTWRELNGDDCVPDEVMARKKSICTSRSFKTMVNDYDSLATHIANFASRCAEKLRRQGSVATVVGVFASTNPFREDLPQYSNYADMQLLTPTSATPDIVKAAKDCLRRIFREGYYFKRAGTIVMGIAPQNGIQTNFLDFDAERYEKLKKLDAAIDKINRLNGSETVVIASQQYAVKTDKHIETDVFANAIRHDFRSNCPTTRWKDIITLV